MEWSDLTAQAIRVGVIVIGGSVAYLIMRALRARILRVGDSATNEAHQRRKTLASVFTTFGIVMILARAQSLRDVIAFPKTQKATCLMTQAPSEVDPRQLKELKLKFDLS